MSNKLFIKAFLLLLITPPLWSMDVFFEHIPDDPAGDLEEAPAPALLETREEQLLAHGSENDIKDLCLEAISNHNTELLRLIIAKATQTGMLSVIELLDNHHVPLNQVMPAPFSGCKPIHIAANAGQKKIATFLVDHYISSINEKATGEYCNQTPVNLAITGEQIAFIEFLAEKKANFCFAIEEDEEHRQFRVGHYPEHFAAETGNTQLMARLISYGADVNKKISTGNLKGANPLHIAILNHHPEMVDFLLTNGCNIDATVEAGNWEGMNALHMAAQLGNQKILETLLRHGAYVDTRITAGTRENATALHLAASFGHLQGVLLLLNYGATPDLVANQHGPWDGFTPLVCAVANDHLEITKRLVWLGARLTRVGPNLQCTVASFAQKADTRDYLTQQAPATQDLFINHYLLRLHGAFLWHQQELIKRGERPAKQIERLTFVAQTNRIQVWNLTNLISCAFRQKADVNIIDLKGVSPVFHFIGPYDKMDPTFFDRVVHKFIKYGLNLNTLDENGYTPLARACEHGNRWLIINLLRHEADPKIGHNPIKAALLNGQSELVHTLCRLAFTKKQTN